MIRCAVIYAVCTGKSKKKCFVAPVIIFDVTAASYCVQELGDSILHYG